MKYVGGVILLFLLLLIISCCKVSAQCSRIEEKNEKEEKM